MQVFYVIYVSDRKVKAYIDAIRLICNPIEKSPAHITIRGPYKKRLPDKFIKSLNEKIVNTSIHVHSIGDFFSSEQNTVFFRCEADVLKDISLKRSYETSKYGFNPHITLYDGDRRDLADQILNIASKYVFDFSFEAKHLRTLTTVKGQAKFPLLLEFDDEFIYPVLHRHIDVQSIRLMTDHERIMIVDQLLRCLSNINNHVQINFELTGITSY